MNMPLWDTVLIALVIAATILFCFWPAFGPPKATAKSVSAAKLLSKDQARPFFLIDINFKAERALYFEAPDALLMVAG
jgi:hypothetical protein